MTKEHDIYNRKRRWKL